MGRRWLLNLVGLDWTEDRDEERNSESAVPNKKMKNETATSEKCVADTTGRAGREHSILRRNMLLGWVSGSPSLRWLKTRLTAFPVFGSRPNLCWSPG